MAADLLLFFSLSYSAPVTLKFLKLLGLLIIGMVVLIFWGRRVVDLEAFSPEKMRFKKALIIAEFCIYRRNGGRAAEAMVAAAPSARQWRRRGK